MPITDGDSLAGLAKGTMQGDKNNIVNSEASSRISAWSRLLRAIGFFIWAVIGLIVVSGLGYYLFIRPPAVSTQRLSEPPAPKKKSVPPVYSQLDKEVEAAIDEAHAKARQYASAELDQWIKLLHFRVSHDFADWYFGYWNTQIRGAKALYDGAVHWVDSDRPTAQEKMTEEFQRQFAVLVLQPSTSQKFLERVQRETLEVYLNNVKSLVEKIPEKYNMSPADWGNYIGEISHQSVTVESARQIPVTMKALYGATAAGTAVLAGKVIKFVNSSLSAGVGIGTKVSSKLAGKVGAKLAAKTGGKVAAKFGGAMLGEIVGVGIIIWDVWDHVTTVKENRPVLINSINGYLDEMQRSLLDDPEIGVMSPVMQLEQQFRTSLSAAGERRAR